MRDSLEEKKNWKHIAFCNVLFCLSEKGGFSMKAKRYLNRAHKGISVFLAVVMVFSVFTGMGSFTANAAAEEAEVYMIDFPRSGDPNPGGDWGYQSLEFMNG